MNRNIGDYNFKGDARSASVDVDGDVEVSVYTDNDTVYFTKADLIEMAIAGGVNPDDLYLK